MYERHFGLKEKPFAITPDADFLYLSPSHTAALTMLEYGVFEQSGVTVVTGGIGTGKTTLVRHLLGSISPEEARVGLITSVHESLGSLLQWIAISLGIDIRGIEQNNIEIYLRLQSCLIDEYASGKRVILIIDEAQNMEVGALEELRMLLNINSDKNQFLHVALIGQPELLVNLKSSSMVQLAQRVTAEYHLEPLVYQETKKYIEARLEMAGAEQPIFSESGYAPIHYLSSGTPRLINALCDHALTLAYGAGKTCVDFETALEAGRQKRIGGIAHFAIPLDSIPGLNDREKMMLQEARGGSSGGIGQN